MVLAWNLIPLYTSAVLSFTGSSARAEHRLGESRRYSLFQSATEKKDSTMTTVRLPLMLLVCTLCLMAQDPFVYTNNNIIAANSISGFSTLPNGALTPIP